MIEQWDQNAFHNEQSEFFPHEILDDFDLSE